MNAMLRSNRRRGERGQGMTEYAIIVVLVAVAALVAVKLFGKQIKGLFGKAQTEIQKETGVKPAP